MTLGDRLRLALGAEDAPRFLADSQELQDVLSQIIADISAKAKSKGMSVELKDACIISFLYDRAYHDKAMQRADYDRATMACVIKYLDWCKRTLANGSLERRWLMDFYIDFSKTNLMPEMYCGWSGRANTNNTSMQYADIRAFLEGRWTPQPVVRDMLALFGLRQVLEAKFRRLLGLNWVEPMPKISHDVVPAIIKRHEGELFVKTASCLRVDSIMQIYNWTDYSIHSMTTSFVWLVWMAVDWCQYVFKSPKVDLEDASKFWHINGSIEIPETTLGTMREEFRKWLAEQGCRTIHSDSVRVTWEAPEAPVVDTNGNLMSIQRAVEIISSDGAVREVRIPSICVLIDNWPSESVGLKITENLKRLRRRNVRVTVLVGECDTSNCPLIPSIEPKMYLVDFHAVDEARKIVEVLDDRVVTSVCSCEAPSLSKMLSEILSSSPKNRLRRIKIADASALASDIPEAELIKLVSEFDAFANADSELTRKLK